MRPAAERDYQHIFRFLVSAYILHPDPPTLPHPHLHSYQDVQYMYLSGHKHLRRIKHHHILDPSRRSFKNEFYWRVADN